MFIPLEPDLLLFPNNCLDEKTLKWLNTPIQDQDLISMRMGFKKPIFQEPKGTLEMKNRVRENRI